MDRQPPLVINLPSMSDDSVVEIHRCLGALIDAFESSYELQLWRYDEQLPEHIRPDKFKGEPF
jgi:hypothetical protein